MLRVIFLQNDLLKCTKITFFIVSALLLLLFSLQSSALLVRLAVGEFLCKKTSLDGLPSIFNSTDDINFNRLFDIVLIPVGLLHIPEHIYFLVYLYKFLTFVKKWDKKYKEDLRLKMRVFVCTKIGRAFCYIFILVLFMLVAIAIPPVCVVKVYTNQNVNKKMYCDEQLDIVTRALTHIYHITSFITNGVVVLVRCLMIFLTIMVGAMWRSLSGTKKDAAAGGHPPAEFEVEAGDNQPDPDQNTLPAEKGGNPKKSQDSDIKDDVNEVFSRHSRYMEEFKDIKEKVGHIYKIFQSFFVLQWIIHLFGLSSHIAHLLRPWIRHGQVDKPDILIVTHQIYQFLFILFDGLALTISHICALKMNTYLRRYIRHTQEKQLEEAKDSNLQLGFSYIVLITTKSVPNSNFSPRIPGTGLRIAINSPTFVLSIVLSIFGLIGALIAF